MRFFGPSFFASNPSYWSKLTPSQTVLLSCIYGIIHIQRDFNIVCNSKEGKNCIFPTPFSSPLPPPLHSLSSSLSSLLSASFLFLSSLACSPRAVLFPTLFPSVSFPPPLLCISPMSLPFCLSLSIMFPSVSVPSPLVCRYFLSLPLCLFPSASPLCLFPLSVPLCLFPSVSPMYLPSVSSPLYLPLCL